MTLTDPIPGLEEALVSRANELAAHQRHGTRRRRWRTPVMTLVAALCVSGVAYSAEGIWHPALGDGRRGPATTSALPVAPSLRQALAVLRGPQSDQDRGRAARYALRFQDQSMQGIQTAAIRTIAIDDSGAELVLIPVEAFQPRANFPAWHDALCMFMADPARGSEGGGQVCGTTEQLAEGALTLNWTDQSGVTVVGVVPDGVTSVAVEHDESRAIVHDNCFVAHVDSMPQIPARWFRSDGQQIGPKSP